MSGSNGPANIIPSATANPDVPANSGLDAASPAMLFGINDTLTGALSLVLYGGVMLVDGVVTAVAQQTLTLTASVHNYIEADRSGTIYATASAFTPGRIALYDILTTGSAISTITPARAWVQPANVWGKLSHSMGSDANYTLIAADARNKILEFAGGSTLTATRNIVLPLAPCQWTVYNNTTGGQSLQFIGASGTGITVANGKRAVIYADGTNVVRVTADT